METRRVVITGLGVFTAAGRNSAEFWATLMSGKSCFAEMQDVDLEKLSFRNAAQIRDFDPADYFKSREERMFDPFAQFALVAAFEAVDDSKITWTEELATRTAVTTGACLNGQITQDREYEKLYKHGNSRCHPFTIPRCMANAAASQISMRYGLKGPVFTTATACSSSSHAIGMAYWMVRSGLVDAAVTGGSEAHFVYGNLKAWDALRVVSPDTCRPFSKDRNGMILGEGGAMFVLETLERALARGAKIYAELCGFGMSADASHVTKPSVEGPASAMRAALEDGAIDFETVGYINAHGTGTQINDSNEVAAIRQVFGAHVDKLAISSTKSMHGHTLGAAGAIEGCATVLALHTGVLPPTANYTEPDPDCDLDVVPNEPRRVDVEVALSNSFAFGGLNAVLAFRKYSGADA